MCGIAGIVGAKMQPIHAWEKILKSLSHRGPDFQQHLCFENHDVGMAHTRLSFLDLSAHGHQPMYFPELKLCISFNGEIYNYLEIKKQLENKGYQFVTQSDTEVLLKAWHCWGAAAIEHCMGMFAFCIYDLSLQKMYLVRDRFGIKPLYYTLQNNIFGFASELKALQAAACFSWNIDWSSVCDFLVYRYVPTPKSIFKNVYKVPPAHYAVYDLQSHKIETKAYWHLHSGHKKVRPETLAEQVNDIFCQSIKQHAIADVPIGAFLSGGYDSSAILYYLKKINYPTTAFSIGFKDWEKSEHTHAQVVADHLQVPLHSKILDHKSLDFFDEMPRVYDEPIADISTLPTYLVSQLARNNVKAVMSGEGADELFGGYWWQKEFYKQHHPASWKNKIKLLWNKPDTLSFYAEAHGMGKFDTALLQSLLHPDLHAFIPERPYWFYEQHLQKKWTPLKQIQYLDIKCFMAELILVKVDRASMAHGLEVRVPFLNHELFETIFAHHESVYYHPNFNKYMLYLNLKNHLPSTILHREKQGFVGPDNYYMNQNFYQKIAGQSQLCFDKKMNTASYQKLMQQDYDWRKWKIAVLDQWYASPYSGR